MDNDKLKTLTDQIHLLENERSALEPDASTRRKLNNMTNAYSDHFLENISSLKAFEDDISKASGIFDEPIEEFGKPFNKILDQLWTCVDNQGLNPASGGHLGYIPGGGIYSSALGDYLAAVTNRYAGISFASPGAVNIEQHLIRWMCDLFDLPQASGGTMCSGGSIANLIGITAARDSKAITPEKIQTSVVYLSDHVHHCVIKALRIAGLETVKIRFIKRDIKDRMDIKELKSQIEMDISNGLNPFLVVSSAGTTDTGAIDDLKAISKISQANNLWHHVDAAYGGFFRLCNEVKHLLDGIESADSIVVDPHKGLFLPYGLGVLLIKNEQLLLRTYHYKANYMKDAYNRIDDYSPADLSPELTRHYRALRMWIPLNLHGLSPFRSALSEKLLLARYAYEKLAAMPHCQIRDEPMLSVVCFRLVVKGDDSDDHINQGLVDFIRKRGKVFLSSTEIDGNIYIRMAILSFRTDLIIIDKAIEEIKSFIQNTIKTNGGI